MSEMELGIKSMNNPFLGELELKVKSTLTEIAKTDKKLIDTRTNEIDNETEIVIAKKKSREKTLFVKVFRDIAIPMDIREMSKATLLLLHYIIFHAIEFNNDKVVLSHKYLCEKGVYDPDKKKEGETGEDTFKASERTHNLSIKELIKRKIIAKHSIKNVFWLNPNYLYYGDRLHLVIHKVNKYEESIYTSDEEPNQTNEVAIPDTNTEGKRESNNSSI